MKKLTEVPAWVLVVAAGAWTLTAAFAYAVVATRSPVFGSLLAGSCAAALWLTQQIRENIRE